MARKKTWLWLFTILAVAGSVLTLLCTSRHVWLRYQGATVLRDARAATDARLYSTRDGMIVLELEDSNEWYATSQDGRWLGLCSPPRGVSILGMAYVSRDDVA